MKAIRSSSAYKKVNAPRNLGNTTQYAVSTEDARETLQHVHVQDGREYAADGFRLHIAPSTADHCETCQREKYNYPDVNCLIPTRHTFEFSTNAAWLRRAAVRAGIFSGVVDTGRIILDASLDNLTVTGWSEELGTSVHDVALLRTEGTPLRFGLNYKFLIDALDHCAPDGGVVVFKLSAPTAPILIEGYTNERAAVVMPVNVADCNPHVLGTYEDNVNLPAPVADWSQPLPEWAEDRDTRAQTNPEPYYTIADLTTTPAENAQECALALVKAEDLHEDSKTILAAFELTPLRPVQAEPAKPRGDKSSRMTWLNRERAKIKRLHPAGSPSRESALRALYATFGNLQRKEPRAPVHLSEEWFALNEWYHYVARLNVTGEFDTLQKCKAVTLKE